MTINALPLDQFGRPERRTAHHVPVVSMEWGGNSFPNHPSFSESQHPSWRGELLLLLHNFKNGYSSKSMCASWLISVPRGEWENSLVPANRAPEGLSSRVN